MNKSTVFPNFLRTAALLFVLALGFTACQKESLPITESPAPESATEVAATDRSNNGTIVDIAVSNPDFSILVAAVLKTDQAGLLSRANLNATVLAPNNAAFAQLPAPFNSAASISAISNPQQIEALRQILRFHIVQGRFNAAQFVNGAYNTYKNAAVPFENQVFVSRNLPGDVFINGASKVIAANVQATNGVIHVIDKVLLPPSNDVAQIAAANGNFTALVAALKKTGLLNNVSMPGNITVFAPTDAAFAQLPAPLNNAANISAISDAGTINTLRNVLRYHVINGRVFSPSLRDNISVPTLLAGENVTIQLTGGPKVKGDGNPVGSNIVLTDLLARNGVIHVIDRVLLP